MLYEVNGVGKLTGETFCRISDKLLYWNPYGMLCIWLANLSEKISDKMLHEIPRRLTFKLLDQASKLELVWHIFTDLTSNFIGSWASVGVKPYQSEIYELNEVCNPPDKDLDRCHHVTVVFFSATWVFNYFCLKFFLTPMISLCPLLKGNKIHLALYWTSLSKFVSEKRI